MFWIKNKKNKYTPVYPRFTIYKWDSRGYSLHGLVILMFRDVEIHSVHSIFAEEEKGNPS